MVDQGKKEGKFGILEEMYDQQDVFAQALSSDEAFSKISKGKSEKSTEKFGLFEQLRGAIKKFIKEFLEDEQRVNRYLSVSIVTLGLAGVVFGFFQFRNTLGKNFRPETASPVSLAQSQSETAPDLLGLRNKDTDQDGLSDWDELNVYNTSPYLPDTDSDDIDDSQEIAQNGDPNCPVGENCFDVFGGAVAESDTTRDAVDQLLSQSGSSVFDLRQGLLDSGVDENELAAFTDEELLQIYQEVLVEQQGTPITTSAETPAQTVTLPADSDFSKLTPAELRILLKNAGVAESILQKVTDQELLQLVAEITAQ